MGYKRDVRKSISEESAEFIWRKYKELLGGQDAFMGDIYNNFKHKCEDCFFSVDCRKAPADKCDRFVRSTSASC